MYKIRGRRIKIDTSGLRSYMIKGRAEKTRISLELTGFDFVVIESALLDKRVNFLKN